MKILFERTVANVQTNYTCWFQKILTTFSINYDVPRIVYSNLFKKRYSRIILSHLAKLKSIVLFIEFFVTFRFCEL